MNMKNLLFLLCLLPQLSAMAADGTPAEAAADTSRVVDLDEVLVVSQPKETARLRMQPLSSSVFGQAEMERLQVRDLRDLSAFTPSFAMPTYGSRLTSSIYMRGTGSRLNAAAPSVPVYVDNIPLLSKSAFNSHFHQIDRVDVLRGPQATLYGMNSEGGLVRIYTRNPMQHQGTDVHLSLGNHFHRLAEVAHAQRLTDALTLSVAAFYSGTDGFFRNTQLNEMNDRSNEAGGRLRMVWKPCDRLTADLVADYQWTRQHAFPYGLYDTTDGSVADPATSFMNKYSRQTVHTGLTLSYELPSLLLSSTTSFQHLYDNMDMDQDYTPRNLMALFQHQRENAWSEELTLRSRNSSRWQWATGLFGSWQDMKTGAPVIFGPDMNGTIAAGILNVMPEQVRQMFTTWEIPTFLVDEQFGTPQQNMAVFHESNVRIGQRLTATVGLRLDHNRTQVDYDSRGTLALHYAAAMRGQVMEQTNTLTDSVIGSTKKHTTQLLPKLGLTWLLGHSGSNVFALVSKGYRAGGYNIQMFSDVMQTEMQQGGRSLQRGDYNITHSEEDLERVNSTIGYEPETSWNYEVGSHLNLFGGSMHADASVYYMQVRNLQLSKMASNYGFGRMMVNAGRSSSCGLELALRGQALADRLSWAATYSFTHATFREYKDSVSANGQLQEADYKGKRVPYVPRHLFAVTADYRFPVGHDALLRSVTVGLNMNGQGKTFWDEANTACQKLYATLGAHALLDLGTCTVDFWGRNLTDTGYATFALPYSGGFIAQRGLPLQFGVDVKAHF